MKHRYEKDRLADDLGTIVLVLAFLGIAIAGFVEMYELFISTFETLTGK
jgi:hypothetical protein